jgi:nucleoside-diphosphate-sugar epimerase
VPSVLVTGGAGFIGSHVADVFLARGYAVDVLDNFSTGRRENIDSRVRLHELDIRSPEAARLVEQTPFDVIVHLAAQIAHGLEQGIGAEEISVGLDLQVLARISMERPDAVWRNESCKDLPAQSALLL